MTEFCSENLIMVSLHFAFRKTSFSFWTPNMFGLKVWLLKNKWLQTCVSLKKSFMLFFNGIFSLDRQAELQPKMPNNQTWIYDHCFPIASWGPSVTISISQLTRAQDKGKRYYDLIKHMQSQKVIINFLFFARNLHFHFIPECWQKFFNF